MQSKMHVTEAEMDQALGGQQVLIPDAAGDLWVLKAGRHAISLTKVPKGTTISAAATRGE